MFPGIVTWNDKKETISNNNSKYNNNRQKEKGKGGEKVVLRRLGAGVQTRPVVEFFCG